MTDAAADPDADSRVDPDAWAGERVARWIRQSAGLERQMAPVSTALFATAALQPGEAVLDVGCGTGPTTREAAALVGAAGSVTGLDVAAEMVDAARAASAAPGSAPIDWVVADAASWDPPAAGFDVVVSRFGVMFFDDPAAAFARLATATRAGGRLAIAVWARRDASPLFEVPYRAALEARRRSDGDVEALPTDGGPFSWHDDAFVTDLLAGAGWCDVVIDVHRLRLPFAGALAPAAAADAAVDFGPTRLVLVDASPAAVEAAREAIISAFTEHVDANGNVVLDATVRVISARR